MKKLKRDKNEEQQVISMGQKYVTVYDLSGTMLWNDSAVPNISALNYLVQNADICHLDCIHSCHSSANMLVIMTSTYLIEQCSETMIILRRHQHFDNWTAPISNLKVGGLSVTLYSGDDGPKNVSQPIK